MNKDRPMLNDPTHVSFISSSSHPALAAMLDAGNLPTNIALRLISSGGGGSVRKGVYSTENQEIDFTLAHSLSKENKPYQTRRTVLRFDIPKVDTNGVKVTSFVYLVVGSPIGGPMTEANFLDYVRTFLYAVLFGGGLEVTTELGSETIDPATGVQILERAIDGEP